MLFSGSTPASKLILSDAGPVSITTCMYLGCVIGMVIYLGTYAITGKSRRTIEAPLVIRNIPSLLGSAALGSILAPACLLISLQYISASSASLLCSFVSVTNTLIAILFFKESISSRIWIAIGLITLACVSLTITPDLTFEFSIGIIGILLTCVFWGFEAGWNRSLSDRDPYQVQLAKGLIAIPALASGAMLMGEKIPNLYPILGAMFIGFFCYSGLPMILYLLSFRHLGIARAGSLFGINPLFGILISFLIFREVPGFSFWIALPIMISGLYLIVTEGHAHSHHHPPLVHEHRHRHTDDHHVHEHVNIPGDEKSYHSHLHAHEEITHTHPHRPDIHHRHSHR